MCPLISYSSCFVIMYDYYFLSLNILAAEKLTKYEKTVAVAAEGGIDMETGRATQKWTYIQAVFFSATILTTIGKYNLT